MTVFQMIKSQFQQGTFWWSKLFKNLYLYYYSCISLLCISLFWPCVLFPVRPFWPLWNITHTAAPQNIDILTNKRPQADEQKPIPECTPFLHAYHSSPSSIFHREASSSPPRGVWLGHSGSRLWIRDQRSSWSTALMTSRHHKKGYRPQGSPVHRIRHGRYRQKEGGQAERWVGGGVGPSLIINPF